MPASSFNPVNFTISSSAFHVIPKALSITNVFLLNSRNHGDLPSSGIVYKTSVSKNKSLVRLKWYHRPDVNKGGVCSLAWPSLLIFKQCTTIPQTDSTFGCFHLTCKFYRISTRTNSTSGATPSTKTSQVLIDFCHVPLNITAEGTLGEMAGVNLQWVRYVAKDCKNENVNWCWCHSRRFILILFHFIKMVQSGFKTASFNTAGYEYQSYNGPLKYLYFKT